MLFYVAAINPVKANPDMRTLLVTTTSKRLYRNRCRQPRWVQAGQAESISGPNKSLHRYQVPDAIHLGASPPLVQIEFARPSYGPLRDSY